MLESYLSAAYGRKGGLNECESMPGSADADQMKRTQNATPRAPCFSVLAVVGRGGRPGFRILEYEASEPCWEK